MDIPEIAMASRLPALFVDRSSFTEAPPGEEPSAMPKAREWKDAPVIRLSRDESRCEARRLREWVRVRCPFGALAKLVAGPREGVSLQAEGEDAVLVFAVRRGERRVFVVEQIWRLGRWWVANDTTWVVSHDWPEGAKAPVVTAQYELEREAER